MPSSPPSDVPPSAPLPVTAAQHIVLYDGLCALCNGLVRFAMRRDRRDRLRFAPLQSPLGRSLVSRHGGDPDRLDTMYLVMFPGTAEETLLGKGRAALTAIASLGGPWRAASLLTRLPAALLDLGYGLVARRRYRLFGRHDSCPMPPPEHRHRFLGGEFDTR